MIKYLFAKSQKYDTNQYGLVSIVEKFLVKSLVVTQEQELILMQCLIAKNKQKSYTNQLLKKLKIVKNIHCLTKTDI